MILRKPFAFLMNNFKKIHFLLLAVSIYVFVKLINIVSLFSNTNVDDYSSLIDYGKEYCGILIFLALIFIIITSVIIMVLLKRKEKKTGTYKYAILINAITIILLIVTRTYLSSFTFSTPTRVIVDIYKDLAIIAIVFQIPIVAIFFARTTGFDIKTFTFNNNLMNFDISSEDSEEFEVELKVSKTKTEAKVNQFRSNIKYIYLENKLIFLSILGAIIVVCLGLFARHMITKEKIYSEGSTFYTQNFAVTLNDSYITNISSSGEILSNKYKYIILNITFKNLTTVKQELNPSDLRITYSKAMQKEPITKYNSKFLEFGVPYEKQTIGPGTTKTYSFIYQIEKEYEKEDFLFKYKDGYKLENNLSVENLIKVDIKPKEFGGAKLIRKANLNEELSFEGSLLKDTKITIHDIELLKNYNYQINTCQEDSCETKTGIVIPSINSKYDLTLMKVHYDIKFNEFDKTALDSIFESFGYIRFVINGKEYESKMIINDVTPYKTDGYAILEVRDKLAKAEKIYIDFNIRDKKYTYIVK